MDIMNEQDRAADRARELFGSGHLCAESVLLAIAESRGAGSECPPGIATGFCSGMARTGGLCGAVSGAILAIGMVMGSKRPHQQVDELYARVRALLAEFEERFGSTNCQALTGCDLGSPEGQGRYWENSIREQCARYTGEAARMTYRLLETAPE